MAIESTPGNTSGNIISEYQTQRRQSFFGQCLFTASALEAGVISAYGAIVERAPVIATATLAAFAVVFTAGAIVENTIRRGVNREIREQFRRRL